MSPITKEFTKEQLIEQAKKNIEVLRGAVERIPGASDAAVIHLKLAEITLASLEAEAVCVIDQSNLDYLKSGSDADVWPACRTEMGDVLLYSASPPAPVKAEPVAWLWSHRKHPSEVSLVKPEDDERAEGAHWSGWSCQALYAAQPASAAIKDHQIRELVNELRDIAVEYHGTQQLRERIARTIRAAMLQGADGNSPVIPDGLRLALSNAGIAAPESDEMLAATCEKNIQALVTWVKERQPFKSAVIPDWQAEAEKMAEIHGSSFVVFRNGESPQCADPTKVIISFTDEGLGHGAEAHFREIVNSSTNNCRENTETSTKCWCRTCRPITLTDMRFVVCPQCGNKRCPHANDHRNACTGSNEPGQEGSAYPAAPQQEVKP